LPVNYKEEKMKRLIVGLLLLVGMIVLFTSMSYAEPGYLYGFGTTSPSAVETSDRWDMLV